MDDATLGKLLSETHRGQADYCEPEGVSVSQSSSSVLFDRARQPNGERDVDQSIGFGITRNTYSAHSKFSENTRTEKVVDRSRKPEERNSSTAQIRTFLEEQRQMIIAEYCEKTGQHEFQATHAEEFYKKNHDTWHTNHFILSSSVYIPPNTEKWLRKLYDKNNNNDTSNEDKHETNYSMNNDTRNMHIT